MRTCAKKKECVNEPIGPFTMLSHCVYGYNIRKELVYSRRDAGGAENQYDDLDRLSSDGGVSYTYDAAGNRMTKTENGETITYTYIYRHVDVIHGRWVVRDIENLWMIVFFTVGFVRKDNTRMQNRGGVRCSKFIFADT